MGLKRIIQDRARAAALRTITRELERYSGILETEPDTTLDILNSGIKVNLKAAKRKGVELLLDTIAETTRKIKP
jgi:hypothetical protein